MINIKFIWQDNKNNYNSCKYILNKSLDDLQLTDLIIYYKNIEKKNIKFTRFERHFKYNKIIKRHNNLIKKQKIKAKNKQYKKNKKPTKKKIKKKKISRKNKYNLTVKSIISLSDEDIDNLNNYEIKTNLFLKPIKIYKDPFNFDHDNINYLWVYSILSNNPHLLNNKINYNENIYNNNFNTYDVKINKTYKDFYNISDNKNYNGKIFYYNSKTYKIINNPIYENKNYNKDKKIKTLDKMKESKSAIKNEKLIKYFKCSEIYYLNYLKTDKLRNITLDFKYEKIINKFIHDENYLKLNMYFKFFQSFIILTSEYLPVFLIKRKLYKFLEIIKLSLMI